MGTFKNNSVPVSLMRLLDWSSGTLWPPSLSVSREDLQKNVTYTRPPTFFSCLFIYAFAYGVQTVHARRLLALQGWNGKLFACSHALFCSFLLKEQADMPNPCRTH